MAVLSLGLPDPSEISHTDVLLFHRSYKYAESAPHPEFDADHSARHFGCCCHWIQQSRILQSHPIQRSGSQEAAFFSLRSSAAAAGSSMPRSLSRNGSADVHRKTAVPLISPMESFRESIFCCLYRRPAQIHAAVSDIPDFSLLFFKILPVFVLFEARHASVRPPIRSAASRLPRSVPALPVDADDRPCRP